MTGRGGPVLDTVQHFPTRIYAIDVYDTNRITDSYGTFLDGVLAFCAIWEGKENKRRPRCHVCILFLLGREQSEIQIKALNQRRVETREESLPLLSVGFEYY